ncbi:hypothetical protein EDD85DRAFT_139010 [Armillaria nabsnona]|nr:hypothetical protein EDD85DRAFT_139010 [Armillaria nabsnona]
MSVLLYERLLCGRTFVISVVFDLAQGYVIQPRQGAERRYYNDCLRVLSNQQITLFLKACTFRELSQPSFQRRAIGVGSITRHDGPTNTSRESFYHYSNGKGVQNFGDPSCLSPLVKDGTGLTASNRRHLSAIDVRLIEAGVNFARSRTSRVQSSTEDGDLFISLALSSARRRYVPSVAFFLPH